MRWFEKQRMAWLSERQEPFNRKHLMEAFDISQPQASNDIGKFIKLHPGAWAYNARKKQYERVLPKPPTATATKDKPSIRDIAKAHGFDERSKGKY